MADVEKSYSVYDLKCLVQDSQGIPPEQQRLVFGAKLMLGPELLIPTLKKESDVKKKNYMIGQGSKEIQALFLNEKKSLVRFRFSKHTEIMTILKEFLDIVKDDLQSNCTSNEYCVKLFCGDRLVFKTSDHYIFGCVLFEDRRFRENKRHLLDYYYPRNEIWSVIIEGYHNGASLEHYQIQDGSTVGVLVRLRGGYSSDFYKHSYSNIKPLTDRICDGINILGICKNKNCERNNEYVIIPYSRNVFFGNNLNEIIELVNPANPSNGYYRQMRKIMEVLSLSESFDFDYDLRENDEKNAVLICRCQELIEPEKVVLRNCYWKYSSIIQTENNGLKRKDSDWELCPFKGWK